tara:strand:- start:376 stop:798 length:423 start_codon:yes stop_codon:yes gene_type:complete
MKKAIFLVIIFLALQGFSQVESGVYSVKETIDFEWDNGKETSSYIYNKGSLMHITECGFRIYKKHSDTGASFPLVYIGLDSDGYYCYAVPFGDRFEINKDIAVLFYNFNNETGWYESSTEWRGLEYISNVPILDYEKEEE